jgi:hypothetical protein
MNPDNFITVPTRGDCWVCGGDTDQVEINFEAYMHPACEETGDRMYWAALSS